MEAPPRIETPPEYELLEPVQRLYPAVRYDRYVEVPLGLRRIDLICIEGQTASWVAIELKISQWRRALEQAVINRQLVDQSFVALWFKSTAVALRNRAMFDYYRVGLVEVTPLEARILFQFPSAPPTRSSLRQRQSLSNVCCPRTYSLA